MTIHNDYFLKTVEYKKKYGNNTVILLQVGAFYEIYGLQDIVTGEIEKSDLLEISQLCNLKIAKKLDQPDNKSVVMIGFRDYSVDKYVPILTSNGWTVPVIKQDMPSSNTTRSLYKIYTPGTTFKIEDKKISNHITCVWLENKNANLLNPCKTLFCGLATIDIYTGQCFTHEFYLENYRHEPSSYDDLERFYSTYKPNEILFIHKNINYDHVDDICKFLTIHVPVRKIAFENNVEARNCEKQNYQYSILNKYYNISDFNEFCDRTLLDEFEYSKQSFCYLLNMINILDKDLIKNINEPIVYEKSKYIILANHSLKQLNIISNDSNKFSSVVNFLISYCATSMGKRQFGYNILNPINDTEELEHRYFHVHYAKNNFSLYQNIRSHLENIIDIEKHYRKISIKRVTPVDIVNFYINIENILGISKILSADAVFSKFADKYNIETNCSRIMNFIKEKLDFTRCVGVIEDNIFNKGVFPKIDELDDLFGEETNKLELIREFLSNVLLKTEKKGRYNLVDIYKTEKSISLISTKKRCSNLKENIKKLPDNNISLQLENKKRFIFTYSNLQYSTASSSKNKIESNLINQIIKNIERYSYQLIDLVNIHYNQFIDELSNFSNEIFNISRYVIDIDMYTTQGYISKKFKYCCPEIKNSQDNSFVKAFEIRHLLVEQFQEQELYVSNDVELGTNHNGIILFGTNAVGKSSLIKSLGICTILAQSGMFVPCTNFIYKPYNSVFTRILGNDNIFKGLSSFAVEMIELNTILKLADSNSLILGDELCSGTETTSAICIFSAGLIKLQERLSSFIFATHFHEICNIKEVTSLQNVVMKHMEVLYNKENDCLVYNRKLKDGPGMNEYGLEVCKSLSMPTDFIDLSYSLRRSLDKDAEHILLKKTSRYNSNKVGGLCELCKASEGDAVHHLQFQCNADEDGILPNAQHKNHIANLINICNECHSTIHRENKQFKKVKTTSGYVLESV